MNKQVGHKAITFPEPSEENTLRGQSFYEKHGYLYVLVSREGRKCLFRQLLNGITVSFEVFTYRVRKVTELHRTFSKIPDHVFYYEALPSDENFGVWAWSFSTLEKAEEKYNQL